MVLDFPLTGAGWTTHTRTQSNDGFVACYRRERYNMPYDFFLRNKLIVT